MITREQWVYVIRAPEVGVGRVKIGHTSGPPEERLSDLQTGSPVHLELIFWTEGNRATEQVLHQLFNGYRIHGEWFEFGNLDPVDKIRTAVDLLRSATEPYDPHRRLPAHVSVKPEERAKERMSSVFAALRTYGSMGTRPLSRVTGISRATLQRTLSSLEDAGAVMGEPSLKPGDAQVWRLVPEHPDVDAYLTT